MPNPWMNQESVVDAVKQFVNNLSTVAEIRIKDVELGQKATQIAHGIAQDNAQLELAQRKQFELELNGAQERKINEVALLYGVQKNEIDLHKARLGVAQLDEFNALFKNDHPGKSDQVVKAGSGGTRWADFPRREQAASVGVENKILDEVVAAGNSSLTGGNLAVAGTVSKPSAFAGVRSSGVSSQPVGGAGNAFAGVK